MFLAFRSAAEAQEERRMLKKLSRTPNLDGLCLSQFGARLLAETRFEPRF